MRRRDPQGCPSNNMATWKKIILIVAYCVIVLMILVQLKIGHVQDLKRHTAAEKDILEKMARMPDVMSGESPSQDAIVPDGIAVGLDRKNDVSLAGGSLAATPTEKPETFPMTFDDPSHYRGPEVEGWPPSRNRFDFCPVDPPPILFSCPETGDFWMPCPGRWASTCVRTTRGPFCGGLRRVACSGAPRPW